MPVKNIKNPRDFVDILAILAYLELRADEVKNAQILNEKFDGQDRPISIERLHQFAGLIESSVYMTKATIPEFLKGEFQSILDNADYSSSVKDYIKLHFIDDNKENLVSVSMEEIAGRGLLALHQYRSTGQADIDTKKLTIEEEDLREKLTAAQDRMRLLFTPVLQFAQAQVFLLKSRERFKSEHNLVLGNEAYDSLPIKSGDNNLNADELEALAGRVRALGAHLLKNIKNKEDNLNTAGLIKLFEDEKVLFASGITDSTNRWIDLYVIDSLIAAAKTKKLANVTTDQAMEISKWVFQVAQDLELIHRGTELASGSTDTAWVKKLLTSDDSKKNFSLGLNRVAATAQQEFESASSTGILNRLDNSIFAAYSRLEVNALIYGMGQVPDPLTANNKDAEHTDAAVSLRKYAAGFSAMVSWLTVLPITIIFTGLLALMGQNPRYWEFKNQQRFNDFCDFLGNVLASPLIALTQVMYHVTNELRQAFSFMDDQGNFSIFNDPVFDRLATWLPNGIGDNLKPAANDAFGKFLMGTAYFLFIKPLQLWFDLPSQIVAKVITGTLRTIFPSIQYFSKEARDKFFNGLSSLLYYLAVGVIATFTGAAIVGGAANAASYVKTVAEGLGNIKVPFVEIFEGFKAIPKPAALSKLGVILVSVFVPLGVGLSALAGGLAYLNRSKKNKSEDELLKSHKPEDLAKVEFEYRVMPSAKPVASPDLREQKGQDPSKEQKKRSSR